jgi:peptidase E
MSGLLTRKIFLTSAGFETEAIRSAFMEQVGKAPKDIKALFIPTAAIFPDAIAVLPACMDDLLNIGIPAENIKVFDLHRSLSAEELSAFDTVYFTGGSSQYLLERINDSGFREPLIDFVDNGGVYVGVSAGSVAASGNLPRNLGYLKATLRVHMETGTAPGVFDNEAVQQIDLTNNQAVMIRGGVYEIIGEYE